MAHHAIRIALLVASMTVASTPAVLAKTAAGPGSDQVTGAGTPASEWGYVVSRKPHAVTYAPSPKNQGNSTGGTNTVTWTETGKYEVTMPGLASDTSAVAPTPPRTAARRCVVQIWDTNGADEANDPACFTTGVSLND